MKFILFPSSANNKSGYGIAVSSDYKKLKIGRADKILWYSGFEEENHCRRVDDYELFKYEKKSFKYLYNLFTRRLGPEIYTSNLEYYYNELNNASEIWCGDYIFYRALRKLFPTKKITVRFHNLHYRNKIRANALKIGIDFKYKYLLYVSARLEKEIFQDKNVTPIFISEEDRLFYELMTKRGNAILWAIEPNEKKVFIERKRFNLEPIEHIVFLGGLSSHKKKSIQYFIEHIWPQIILKHKNLQFHLFGKGTELYDKKTSNVYGHGFLESDSFPFASSALYINPDLIGGGVKIKVLSLLENAIPFITNNFGFEGYDIKYADSQFCIIKDFGLWEKEIDKQIKERKKE